MADAQSTTPSTENAFDPQVLLGKFKTFVKDTHWVHAAEIEKATKQEAWMVVGAVLGILIPMILMMWGTAIVTCVVAAAAAHAHSHSLHAAAARRRCRRRRCRRRRHH
jgi:hypothetical protein